MSDDNDGIDLEQEEDEGHINLTVDNTPAMVQISGDNSVILLRNPSAEATPFDYIKGCIGVSVYSKPNSAQPDDFKYLVMVGDSFEWREITECLNVNAQREYTPTVKLRTVN